MKIARETGIKLDERERVQNSCWHYWIYFANGEKKKGLQKTRVELEKKAKRVARPDLGRKGQQ